MIEAVSRVEGLDKIEKKCCSLFEGAVNAEVGRRRVFETSKIWYGRNPEDI